MVIFDFLNAFCGLQDQRLVGSASLLVDSTLRIPFDLVSAKIFPITYPAYYFMRPFERLHCCLYIIL